MIINSLLDNDFYKFTMGYAVFENYYDANVVYRFKDRNGKIKASYIMDRLEEEINHLCGLVFEQEDIYYLRNLRLFDESYLSYLYNYFKFKREYIHISEGTDGGIELTIEGPWRDTIYYEVPLLSIISELYCNYQLHNNEAPVSKIISDAKRQRDEMFDYLFRHSTYVDNLVDFNGFRFADFGTRRRFSFRWQEGTLSKFLSFGKNETVGVKIKDGLIGTSNVFFARQFNIKPIGTMAHEWLMAHQALCPNLIYFQKEALKVWTQTFQGDVGIALSDVIGFDRFLNDFSFWCAMTYKGVRHDSGNPVEWCKKLINHYKNNGIDPTRKTAVFSDGLNIHSAYNLFLRFKNEIDVSFGIGTKFTNNIPHINPPNIVIKMVLCNGKHVAKISDSPGKGMCESPEFLNRLNTVFDLKIGAV